VSGTGNSDGPEGIGRPDEFEATDRPDRPSAPSDDVEHYAEAVRAELSDLPAAALTDLLEDLEDHLREVAAEDTGDLRERLGTPAAYAAELRASAGLPERGAASASAASGSGSTAASGSAKSKRRSPAELLAAFEAWLRTQWLGREVLDFLPQLRPAWWIVRAWLAVFFLQLVTYDDGGQIWIIPRPGGSAFLGLLLLLFAIGGSIWLTRRPPFEGRRGRLFAIAQGALGLLAFVALAHSSSYGGWNGPRFVPSGYSGPGGLNDGGRPISNLYVYDQSGKLLSGVYVYDQDGIPVQVDHEDTGVTVTQTFVDADGAFVFNRYPEQQARLMYGADGSQHLVRSGPPSVTVPQGLSPAGALGPAGPNGDVPDASDAPSGPTSATASAATPSASAPSSASSTSSASSAASPATTAMPATTPSPSATRS
jgi:hypothetical protein